MDKVTELRQALKAKQTEMERHLKDGDISAFDAADAEQEGLAAQLDRALKMEAINGRMAKPVVATEPAPATTEPEVAPVVERAAEARALVRGRPTIEQAYSSASIASHQRFERALSIVRSETGFRPNNERHFPSLGAQLQAIYTAATSRGMNVDPRLVFARAPSGAGEVDPTGGGFLVQTDFAQAVWMIAHDMGEVLGQVNRIPIGDKFNGIKIPGVDETSRATGSRWGGVQSYWADEGNQPAATKPKFRMIEFSLHKLMSLMYTSDELLMDSSALTSIASQAFSEEITFMTEDAIIEGTGVGQPLGILKAPSLITVAAQTGQKSGTVVKENIDAMWARLWARSRKNAVWLINQDLLPQLFQLNQAVGTGGQLVFMPPGGVSNAPYATLLGRPIIETEYNPAVGSVGDIALVDLSQYTVVDKGGIQAATSMHVAFLTDQQVFRITYRVDGQPMWTAPLTRFRGGTANSPFVALAAR